MRPDLRRAMRLLAVFFILLSNAPALADDGDSSPTEEGVSTRRSSELKLSVLAGRDRYRSWELSGRLGLSPVFAIVASGASDKSERVTTATRGDLGMDAILDENLSLNLRGQSRKDLDLLKAKGASGGFSWVLSSLWSAENRTELSVQTSFLAYTYEGALRELDLDQFSVTYGVSQELDEAWEIYANYSDYRMNSDARTLAEFLAQRPAVTADLLSVVNGFPEWSFAFGASREWDERFRSDVSFFRSEYFAGGSSRGIAIKSDYDLTRSWNAGVGVSVTRYPDGGRNGLFELSVAYRW